jgi:hypothetical protein
MLLPPAGWAVPAASPQPAYPVVTPGAEFRFPRDDGAHPAYRTEWWCFTGWLEADLQVRGVVRGVQADPRQPPGMFPAHSSVPGRCAPCCRR